MKQGIVLRKRLLENKAYDFPLIHMGVYKVLYGIRIRPPRPSFFKNSLSDIRINISQDNYFSDLILYGIISLKESVSDYVLH